MKILLGECLELMRQMDDNSVDSIVTDPPYGLSFMGKKRDYDVPSQEIREETLRILKPGGYLLAFAGTRTQHRMAVRIEDAGFEIRDMIAWVYGSGFPKSLNISKAIDKGLDMYVKGEVLPSSRKSNGNMDFQMREKTATNPQSDDAIKYNGRGTALKPALEPITVARKPLGEKTVADNVLKWGTGGINIDESRVETDDLITNHSRGAGSAISKGKYGDSSKQETHQTEGQENGRFPANFIHDGSDEVQGLLNGKDRFFYCAKASKEDRNYGLDNFEKKEAGIKNASGRGFSETEPMRKIMRANNHPTVKPTDLMRYLVKLVTPKGGIVLDPFMGSGSTGKACKLEGFEFIGCEMDEEYLNIAQARIEAVVKVERLF